MSLKLNVASCTEECYRTADSGSRKSGRYLGWLWHLILAFQAVILLQQTSLRKTVSDGSVLHPFCTSVFPLVCVAQNFSDLFQIFIFLAVILCWRDKWFSSASLALCWTRLNIKKPHFYLNSSFYLWFTLKEMVVWRQPWVLPALGVVCVSKGRSSGDLSESP